MLLPGLVNFGPIFLILPAGLAVVFQIKRDVSYMGFSIFNFFVANIAECFKTHKQNMLTPVSFK